ncbi:SPOR domain-containing protein [Halomonas saccharevitans]|uniref:SPOR domain-containing protein n=1 Tax=Halomonas saccharevitans TaxID=416872 RepID=A0ABU3NB60_9GAMM|nr:SPOR domain-containing protein [Halomonas saccharevitans]MDT8878436.1 SPOR domain-containing protein [Halomonas saccharevitans]
MRERLSGAVILIALAVIFLPMLFDEPAPRGERPQPVMTIEQPVEVERREVPDPQPPESLDQAPEDAAPDAASATPEASSDVEPAAESPPGSASTPPERERVDEPAVDPIAELARAADERLAGQQQASATPVQAAPDGEWAVQVGSFGESANAERLEAKLADQGLPVYRRARDNGLTTVYVGPFASSREGERVMGELKAQNNLQGLLVRADRGS